MTTTTPAASPKLLPPNFNDSDNDEATTSKIFSPTWGHYENLMRLMTDIANRKKRYPGELAGLMLQSEITATEKVDGSNLAMWVRYNPKMGDDKKDPTFWEVLLLQGRSAALWKKEGFEVNPSPAADQDKDEEDANQDDGEAPTREQLLAQAQADLKKLTTLPGYGNAGQLQQLIIKMRDFCVRVANILNVDEIEIFGEAFRAKKVVTQTNAKKEVKKFEQAALRASWHPFGYKLPPSVLEQKNTPGATTAMSKLNRLTAATHKIFTAAIDTSIVPQDLFPKSHDEFIDLLTNTQIKDFIVIPPVLHVAKTPLADAIVDTLGPLLLNSTQRAFEGVFIVHEEGWFGCKFKTGTHDEQGKIPSAEELGIGVVAAGAAAASEEAASAPPAGPAPITDKKIIAAFEIMTKIYKTKIAADKSVVKSKPPADPAIAAQKAIDQKILADVEKATQREFSKRLSFNHIDRGQRQPIIDSLIPAVIKEVMEIYKESDQEMPFTEQQLKAKTPNFVKACVLKVPFQPPATAAAEGGDKKKNDGDDDE